MNRACSLVLLTIAPIFLSCSSGSDELLGKWERFNQNSADAGAMEFFHDRTCFVEESGQRTGCRWGLTGDGLVKVEIELTGWPNVVLASVRDDFLDLDLVSSTTTWVRVSSPGAQRVAEALEANALVNMAGIIYIYNDRPIGSERCQEARDLLGRAVELWPTEVSFLNGDRNASDPLVHLAQIHVGCPDPSCCDPEAGHRYAEQAVAKLRGSRSLALRFWQCGQFGRSSYPDYKRGILCYEQALTALETSPLREHEKAEFRARFESNHAYLVDSPPSDGS